VSRPWIDVRIVHSLADGSIVARRIRVAHDRKLARRAAVRPAVVTPSASVLAFFNRLRSFFTPDSTTSRNASVIGHSNRMAKLAAKSHTSANCAEGGLHEAHFRPMIVECAAIHSCSTVNHRANVACGSSTRPESSTKASVCPAIRESMFGFAGVARKGHRRWSIRNGHTLRKKGRLVPPSAFLLGRTSNSGRLCEPRGAVVEACATSLACSPCSLGHSGPANRSHFDELWMPVQPLASPSWTGSQHELPGCRRARTSVCHAKVAEIAIGGPTKTQSSAAQVRHGSLPVLDQ